MAKMPIEIVLVGTNEQAAIMTAIATANSLQNEFEFCRLDHGQEQEFAVLAFDKIYVQNFLDLMAEKRNGIRGFHPFMLALVDASLDGENYSNLFGSNRAEIGLAVLTSAQVPDVIVPRSKMVAYYLYYFARNAHSFIAPKHKNHIETRGCIYDVKVHKPDLLKSMKAGAFCNECRKLLVSGDRPLSSAQFVALERIFAEAGRLVRDEALFVGSDRPRIFIGSSAEGLPVARKLQASLSEQFAVEIWNQGTVFGLGTSTLEALENAVDRYDFGVFIFTPDDALLTRGETKPVARDNVVFELGLFAGRLGRNRAFAVRPRGAFISLPTDLAGITTANYDYEIPNLTAAVEPACEQIRDAVAATGGPIQRAAYGQRR